MLPGLSFLPPGAGPATMPGAVPGASSPVIPGGGLPPGAIGAPAQGAGLMPAGAIPGAPSAFLPPGSQPGGMPEYATEVQTDGSILLRLKNPDGSPGPVLKIIEPIKPRVPAGQGGQR